MRNGSRGFQIIASAWMGYKNDVADQKRSALGKYCSFLIFLLAFPFLICVAVMQMIQGLYRFYHSRFGLPGVLIPVWFLVFGPLVGWAIWYNQPSQKNQRDLQQISTTECHLEKKQREISRLVEQYEQELQILQAEPGENQNQINHTRQQLDSLRLVSQKLSAGKKELSVIRTDLEVRNQLNQVFDRKEVERLQDSIEDILQKHTNEEMR